MLRRSKIGWCDYSGGDPNVVIRGKNCPISEGCANCYVERDFKRWGRKMTDGTTIYPKKLRGLARAVFDPGDVPYRRGPDSKPIIFVADYGDLFCEDVPDHFIHDILDVLWHREDADWILLTKRPQRMLDVVDLWLCISGLEILPSNIWCLVTAENQRRADERIPILLQVKAQVRGVSLEPMLEPVYLVPYIRAWGGVPNTLDWVIVGAESGPNRRHFERQWAYTIHEHCTFAGIPFFGKQDSHLRPGYPLFINGKTVKEFPQT